MAVTEAGAAVERPQFLVLHLKWTDADGTQRQEMFGPWTVAEDDSHLEHVTAFMGEWRSLVTPEDAVMVALVDPDEWVRQQKGSDDG
jgi:hypothetical protein